MAVIRALFSLAFLSLAACGLGAVGVPAEEREPSAPLGKDAPRHEADEDADPQPGADADEPAPGDPGGGDPGEGEGGGDPGGDADPGGGDDDPIEPEPDPGTGTWDDPFEIITLPASLSGDTAASLTDSANAYSPCAPGTNESGPEVVYHLRAPADGTLSLGVDDQPGDGIDVDVQLLDAPEATACLARHNTSVAYPVVAGQDYWIAVDSWSNGTSTFPGPYVLSVSFSPANGSGGCPSDMVEVAALGGFCMDRYEAPNLAGALPLVMYTFYQSEAWCQARGKRLCYDDEWTAACEGPSQTPYPYGSHQSGICNDEEIWRTYDQTELNKWPGGVCTTSVTSLDALLDAAAATGTSGTAAASHVSWLYQGEGGGMNAGCTNAYGAFDLTGNVEEWTRRRTSSDPDFSGNLKGRYWAEARTCQQSVTTHGNAFRFYEIGFRCCL